MTPIRSAVTSRQFGGSCSGTVSGWRGHQRVGDRRLFGQPLPRLHDADLPRERFNIPLWARSELLSPSPRLPSPFGLLLIPFAHETRGETLPE
jgi:hypothetical protein